MPLTYDFWENRAVKTRGHRRKHVEKGKQLKLDEIFIVHLKGASKPLKFSNKKSFDTFIDMLASLDKVSVEVACPKNNGGH